MFDLLPVLVLGSIRRTSECDTTRVTGRSIAPMACVTRPVSIMLRRRVGSLSDSGVWHSPRTITDVPHPVPFHATVWQSEVPGMIPNSADPPRPVSRHFLPARMPFLVRVDVLILDDVLGGSIDDASRLSSERPWSAFGRVPRFPRTRPGFD